MDDSKLADHKSTIYFTGLTKNDNTVRRNIGVVPRSNTNDISISCEYYDISNHSTYQYIFVYWSNNKYITDSDC